MSDPDERRSLLQLPRTPGMIALQLLCTGRGKHARRRIVTVSWAPDGRGVVLHALHRHSHQKRRKAGETDIGAGIEDRDEGRDDDGLWLNATCPKCGTPFETAARDLLPILKEHGVPGSVVDHVIW